MYMYLSLYRHDQDSNPGKGNPIRTFRGRRALHFSPKIKRKKQKLRNKHRRDNKTKQNTRSKLMGYTDLGRNGSPVPPMMSRVSAGCRGGMLSSSLALSTPVLKLKTGSRGVEDSSRKSIRYIIHTSLMDQGQRTQKVHDITDICDWWQRLSECRFRVKMMTTSDLDLGISPVTYLRSILPVCHLLCYLPAFASFTNRLRGHGPLLIYLSSDRIVLLWNKVLCVSIPRDVGRSLASRSLQM